MPGELISRDALERIIKRAAELQAGEREIGDGLTNDEVLALGKDVGIPTRYLQQAMLEERTRSPVVAAQGFLGWLFGSATLAAERVAPGDRASVERALIQWMESEELLEIKRRYPDRVTWEPKRGAFASIQRALGKRPLGRCDEIAGQVTQLEPGFCHVRLVASVRPQRQGRIGGTLALAGFGALGATGVIVAGLAAPIAALPLAGLALAAISIGRAHVRENEKVQVGLEQVLDKLERGEIKATHALPGPQGSAFLRIAAEIRKTFQV